MYNVAYSETCKTSTGTFKREYRTEGEAEESALYLQQRYGTPQKPYECAVCSKWHLAPTEKNTNFSFTCGCIGYDGNPKRLYETEEDAMKAQKISAENRNIILKIYPCERASGYHLSKGIDHNYY